MNRLIPAFLLFLALLASCRFIPGKHYGSVGDVSWRDFGPFSGSMRTTNAKEHPPQLPGAPIYHLVLSVSDDLKRLTGKEKVRYTNTGNAGKESLDFVLFPNIVSGSLSASHVRVNGGERPVHIVENEMVLRVTLPGRIEPGESVVVSIDYSITLPTTTKVGFGGLESTGDNLSLAYAYPMIPLTGEWPYGKPPAYGDVTVNPASYYVTQLSYPKGFVVAAPGVVLNRRQANGREEILIAFGPARDFYLELASNVVVTRREASGVELRAFTSPERVKEAGTALDTARGALMVYDRLFGPYPYRSLTLVRTRFAAYGLEFPGIIVLASWLFENPSRIVEGVPIGTLQEATVAHEVAHQWFYALVGDNQLIEPWVDESFAQYATWRYYLDRYGERGAAGFLRSLEGRWARIHRTRLPIGAPVSHYTPLQYSAVIYGEGPLFLMKLSDRMGVAVFDGFLRDLVRDYRWKSVSGDEIKRVAEKRCSCSLDDLWAEWVTPFAHGGTASGQR